MSNVSADIAAITYPAARALRQAAPESQRQTAPTTPLQSDAETARNASLPASSQRRWAPVGQTSSCRFQPTAHKQVNQLRHDDVIPWRDRRAAGRALRAVRAQRAARDSPNRFVDPPRAFR